MTQSTVVTIIRAFKGEVGHSRINPQVAHLTQKRLHLLQPRGPVQLRHLLLLVLPVRTRRELEADAMQLCDALLVEHGGGQAPLPHPVLGLYATDKLVEAPVGVDVGRWITSVVNIVRFGVWDVEMSIYTSKLNLDWIQ